MLVGSGSEELGFFAKAGKFLRQVWLELRRVVWPNRQQTIIFTVVVFAAVLFASTMIWVIDALLAGLFSLVMPR